MISLRRRTVKTGLVILFLLAASLQQLRGQSAPPRIYDPAADAEAQLDEAIDRAAIQGKHVLAIVGGNWCSWCLKLDRLMKTDPLIDSLLLADYVVLHINHSKENRNLAVLGRLGHPARFGFPVLVVLNGEGLRIHTQASGMLENDGGHDPELVARFLRLWSPLVLDPSTYQ